jgi:hypothetical protein
MLPPALPNLLDSGEGRDCAPALSQPSGEPQRRSKQGGEIVVVLASLSCGQSTAHTKDSNSTMPISGNPSPLSCSDALSTFDQ